MESNAFNICLLAKLLLVLLHGHVQVKLLVVHGTHRQRLISSCSRTSLSSEYELSNNYEAANELNCCIVMHRIITSREPLSE